MQGMKVTCHKINSGYGTDYGYIECEVKEVVHLNGVPTIKVWECRDENATDYPIHKAMGRNYFQPVYLAWFREGEWVVDLD